MSVVLSVLLLSNPAVAQEIVSVHEADPGASVGHGTDELAAPIYGGRPVLPGAWADTAAVLDGRDEVFCTGTLIAPRVVLTAGHCVADGANPSKVVLASDTIDGGERIEVDRAVAYPNWIRTYDVAVLILKRDATTRPRTIASGCVVRDHLRDGAEVAIVGYGVTETDDWNEAKNVVDHDCTQMDDFDCLAGVSPGAELEAGGGGEDSCYGDSGGPVYLRTELGDFLVGVTSRGADLRSDCGAGGIYVRPDAVIDWIESAAAIELDEPTCDGHDDTGFADGDDCEGGYFTTIPYETGCSVVGSGAAAGALLPGLLVLLRRRRR